MVQQQTPAYQVTAQQKTAPASCGTAVAVRCRTNSNKIMFPSRLCIPNTSGCFFDKRRYQIGVQAAAKRVNA